MAVAKIDLEWHRDAAGYDLVPETPGRPGESLLGSTAKPMRIVARGGRAIRYRPLENDWLYAKFASLHAPDDVVEFIRKFGPLTAAGHDPDWGEAVAEVLEYAESFRAFLSYAGGRENALASWVGPEGKQIVQLSAVLVQDPATGALHVQLRPGTLLAGLWVQLAEKLSGNRPFRECRFCRTWFETGPGTGRRLDAQFCTDEHRVRFNSLKRSKGDDHA